MDAEQGRERLAGRLRVGFTACVGVSALASAVAFATWQVGLNRPYAEGVLIAAVAVAGLTGLVGGPGAALSWGAHLFARDGSEAKVALPVVVASVAGLLGLAVVGVVGAIALLVLTFGGLGWR